MKRTALGLIVTLALSSAAAGCNNDAATTDAGARGDAAQTLYAKYGGAATVTALVDQAVTGLLADCTQAPFFTSVLGQPGHDSAARLKSCLRLQFTAALGGPATYPGRNDQGDMCEDMATAHRDLGIPGDVFDKFIMDLGAVLQANHVEPQDITTIAGVLTSMRGDIVSSTPHPMNACGDGGASGDAGH